jgi:2-hydroxy-6-oxonona-2,4-dienedioate hydrolase
LVQTIVITVLIVASLLVGFYMISQRRLRVKLASMSQILQTDAGLIEYIDQGTGPVILHAHGMAGGYDHIRWCEYLVKAGFRVIVPSRPGYLRTPLSSGKSPEEQAALYIAFLDALDIDKVILYAYSQGGSSSLQFAWMYPDRCCGLILFSAITRSQPDLEKFLPIIRIVLSLNFLLWLLSTIMVSWLMSQAKKELAIEVQQDESKMADIQDIFEAIFQTSIRGKGLINDFNNSVYWQGLPLDRLAVPTLIMHGDKDTIINPKDSLAAANEILGSTYLSLKGAGHEAIAGSIDQIEPTVLDFLNKHSR